MSSAEVLYMSGLKHLFCEHPESVNETYFEHLMFATGFGLRMLLGGLACVVNGVLPFMFKRTGSQCVRQLHGRLTECGRPVNDAHIERDRAVQN